MTFLRPKTFRQLFDCFQKSAYRLQLLPEYAVAEEADEYAAYRAGEPLPETSANAWLEKMSGHVAQGKDWTNVHLLPDRLTPYLRYLIDWGYVYHHLVGAKILFLPSRYAAAMHALAPQDFWLFDDRAFVLMRYGPGGRFLGAEEGRAPSALASARRARDFAIEHADNLRTILARRRTGELI